MPWKAPPRAGATVLVWAGYSLAERDRRWRAVREAASKAGFDCVLVPLGDGIDGRYMTQLRCSAMALPTDGRPPIVIADRSSRNEWVPDPWQTGREWAEPMAEALVDLGMRRGRIGVAGLRRGKVTHVSSPEGVVNHTALAEVMRKLPDAAFEDATDVIGFVRYVKSEEELEFVRRSAAVAAAGVEEAVKLARPGLDAAVLYAGVMERLLELRSEYYPLALTIDSIDGRAPKRYTNPPLGRRLEEQSLIVAEVNAIVGAQLTQICQPVVLGKMPDAWRPVVELHEELYEAGLELMKPGAELAALKELADGFGARRGMKAFAQLQGCGYGDDGPLVNAKVSRARLDDLRIQAGNAFLWKPLVMTADETIRFAWGGPVIVTPRGAEPLLLRPHGMVSIA
ncbi:MAG TPA: M24 family metallopeptidase [Candidatus Acidoferrales bacterium]|nr:M24 family metallopeptidase [Candidatus Acidoferrales bacterium]